MIHIDKNNNNKIVSTFLNPQLSFPNNLKNITIEGGITIGHFKVNNEPLLISDPLEVYSKLEGWDESTLLNSFFNKDLEAGNLKGRGEGISKILIKRLSSKTKYKKYETIGEIPYTKENQDLIFKDYLINSNEVYLYSIQPVTEQNHYGAIQTPQPGLNLYDHSWLLESSGEKIEILDSEINNITINTKDGIIETIGGKKPYVSRFSNLDYKTFQISGTIASVGDFNAFLLPQLQKDIYTEDSNIKSMIEKKFLEKTGALPSDYNNNIRNDNNFERLFKEKVISILKNGKPKIFKSPTEGLLLIKITNINITPKRLTNGIICDFSATATEIGEVDEDLIKNFIFKEER